MRTFSIGALFASLLLMSSCSFHAMVEDLGDGLYCLPSSSVTLTVDASHGGKVSSLKYMDTEILSQAPQIQTGSIFWTSPQSMWNWPPIPEMDSMPFSVEECSDQLVLKSQLSEKLPLRLIKTYKALKGGAFSITYSLTNESSSPISVAPWEITRVPNEGVIFFDAPLSSITPEGLMNFEEKFGAVWYQTDVVQRSRKINADGSGWLAYKNDGYLFVKAFPDIKQSEAAPKEAEVEVYVYPGKNYIELENQGAFQTLQVGESLSWTVKWYLKALETEPAASEALLKAVKKLL